ncbi:MAG: hypothetical protein Q8P74_01840 [bacterium]|nr:hypothetical protein [bacterium]
MKKLSIIIFIGAIFLSTGVAQSVLAEEFTGELQSPIEHKNFGDLIGAITGFLRNIALFIAPIFIIIGAFYFVAAAGDPAKIKTGQKIILFTLIGFLIIFLAEALVNLLTEDILKVKEIVD